MIIKQPNGKFCITKLNGDIEKMNLTEEEYIALVAERAKEQAKKDLAEIKNKRICPKCSMAIEKTSVYCNFCGEKLIFEEE